MDRLGVHRMPFNCFKCTSSHWFIYMGTISLICVVSLSSYLHISGYKGWPFKMSENFSFEDKFSSQKLALSFTFWDLTDKDHFHFLSPLTPHFLLWSSLEPTVEVPSGWVGGVRGWSEAYWVWDSYVPLLIWSSIHDWVNFCGSQPNLNLNKLGRKLHHVLDSCTPLLILSDSDLGFDSVHFGFQLLLELNPTGTCTHLF